MIGGGLVRFGEKLASALGEGPSAETQSLQRRRLVDAFGPEMAGTPLFSKRRAVGMVLAFAVAGIAAVVIGMSGLHPRPVIHATWNGASVYGPSVFEAATSRPQSLDFSEGSQILLEPDTRASLARLSAHNADLTLEEGHLLASIRKHTGLVWTVAAGPYRIRVVGTRFTLDWDADRHHLRVAVREGRVKVSGGNLPSDGVVLDAGAMLERGAEGAPSQRLVEGDVSAQAEAKARAEVHNRAASALTRPAIADTAEISPASSGTPALTKWSTLAKQGMYKDALALAEQMGFDALVSTLGEDDLLLLANAARYSGDASRAHQAQLKLRERFAGHRSAALAAFYLARSALDVEHRPDAAIHWFETFLVESPRGDLAALARAHLMSLWLNKGQREKAREIAQSYLKYHPDGAKAAQARSLVQSAR